MKVGIMQPYLFPYIGYFQLINAVDIFVIYDDVNYIKQGWINRNNILIKDLAHRFVLPLEGASSNKMIKDLEIDRRFYDKWKINFFKTLKQSYGRAPYYNEVVLLINDILSFPDKNLASFLKYSLQLLCNYFNIKTTLKLSSEIQVSKELKSQAKVIKICEELEATEYINATGGRQLYDKIKFLEHSIILNFIRSNNIEYKQFGSVFIPWLSIIDVIMFNDVKEITTMLNDYKLD